VVLFLFRWPFSNKALFLVFPLMANLLWRHHTGYDHLFTHLSTFDLSLQPWVRVLVFASRFLGLISRIQSIKFEVFLCLWSLFLPGHHPFLSNNILVVHAVLTTEHQVAKAPDGNGGVYAGNPYRLVTKIVYHSSNNHLWSLLSLQWHHSTEV
jgi:hypothetical protein